MKTKKEFTKKEARDYLGVSIRTVENYIAKHKLSVDTKTGTHGDYVVIDAADLRRLKAELDARRAPRGSVSIDAPGNTESPEDEPRTLARLSDITPEAFGALLAVSVAAGVREVLQKAPPQLSPAPAPAPEPTPTAPTASELAHKLLLSLPEAATLSGIPVANLRSAVKSGSLRAVKSVGRGLGKVRRADLEAYARKLK